VGICKGVLQKQQLIAPICLTSEPLGYADVAENADGSKYQGPFANILPDGPGTYVAANGDIYQGNFKAAKADGQFLVTRKAAR
jgi:hypothetical protein